MNSLHWRKAYPWLYRLVTAPGDPSTSIFAEGGLHRDWIAYIHSPDKRHAFPIRCRSLREAADCARRWAEYRGFVVSERFPTT